MAHKDKQRRRRDKNSYDEKEANEQQLQPTVYIANPPSMDGVADLSSLIHLEMNNVLHNVEYRFCKMARKSPYTSVSTILLAINPYERLPIYGQDVINEFHNAQKKGRLPQGRPHPYGVSARSYMRMIQRRENQSIIVCGESGAGKTETTKLLMRYLAMTAAPSTNTELIVEQQIIAASPILEAYGNAKTVLNNNSSRFGKFTKLLYDVPEKAREGRILGSYLETYLLEKSRVVFQANNERNYHIPYFLYHGVDKNAHHTLGIVPPEQLYYANQGGTAQVAGINDAERFKELAESLRLMRVDDDTQNDLWRITSGIFMLGNVCFRREGDGFASIDPTSKQALLETARLWNIDATAFETRLTTSNLKARGQNIVRKIKFEDAATNRDSIAKSFYENVFLYLCQRINAELYQTDEEDIKSILFIGILDVFGFENFYINSLEQFCINFTNEKLQQFFNYHIIQSEQEEYIKEGVQWTELTVPNNVHYLDLIEHKDYGFFKLLDSACKAPQPDSEALMQELFNRHGDNGCLKRVTQPGSGQARGKPKSNGGGNNRRQRRGGANNKFDGFEVRHFADLVAYDVSKFLIKNMEAVHPDTAKMLKKSKNVLVQEIGSAGPKGRKKKSVTAVFAGGIKTLMKNLHATEPYFVRCVNPNMQKSSTIWTESVVEHQLRCGGLVEALKVLKLGYPTRVPYSTLYDEYHGNVTNPLIKNMGPESFSTALLIAFDVNEDDYELGLTKIFFKPSKAAVLDAIMGQAGQPLSVAQNEKITKWVVKKRIKQMVGSLRAFLELRKRVRLTRAEARWRYAGRIAALLGGTVLNHLDIARKNIIERKKKEAALGMQAFFRGTYQRSKYLKRIDKVRKATKMVWICYRRYQDRIELQKWLDVKVEETRKREEERRKREAEEARQRAIEEERRKAAEAEAERKRKEAMAEEDRKNYEAKKKQEELERARAEEERQAKEREEEERKRLDDERKKAADAETQREQERKLKEEEERKHKEEDDARLEQERDAARKRIEQKSLTLQQEKKVAESEEREERKQKREKKIKSKRDKRRKAEDRRKDEEEEEYIKTNFSEMVQDSDEDEEQDSDYDSSGSDSADPVLSIAQQLKQFEKIAATGQLFLKYTGKRRRKPQDRIVKVSFDNKYKPKQISWGSGSRHIDFNEILYIAWGHWTPVFEARKDQLDPKLCFSVVGKQQILDVQAQSKEMAELWVRGLRKLVGHSDEKSDKLSKQAMESGNLPGFNSKGDVTEVKKAEREHKKRTKSLMLLQQDLFVMTTTTVFRNLEEERIWDIDQSVRERFNAKSLYELALREDIPWRQWNHWVREKIVTYLRENNRIANPQTFGGAGGGGAGGAYGGPPPQFGGMQSQPSQYGQMQSQPSQYGQMGGHRPNQPSYNQLPGYGQPPQAAPYQQPPPQQFIPQNVNLPPQQPMQFNMTPQQMQNMQQMGGAAAQTAQGGGGGATQGQVGPNGEECSLM